jgi:hypothetical protein
MITLDLKKGVATAINTADLNTTKHVGTFMVHTPNTNSNFELDIVVIRSRKVEITKDQKQT